VRFRISIFLEIVQKNCGKEKKCVKKSYELVQKDIPDRKITDDVTQSINHDAGSAQSGPLNPATFVPAPLLGLARFQITAMYCNFDFRRGKQGRGKM